MYARNPSDKTGGSTSPADDGYATDDDEGKGWQLLNNVESGGTLSSLFTILSLFTEDVKLRYEEDGQPDDSSDDGMDPHHRRDADVAAFDLDFDKVKRPGFHPDAGAPAVRQSDTEDADEEDAAATEREHERAHDSDALDSAIKPSDSRSNATTPSGIRSPASEQGSFFLPSAAATGASTTAATSPPASTTSRSSRTSRRTVPTLSTLGGGGGGSTRRPSLSRPTALPHRPSLAARHPPYAARKQSSRTLGGGGLGGKLGAEGVGQGEATIARAATDTTLAVIPAEAFRRLTKKFPNAAA